MLGGPAWVRNRLKKNTLFFPSLRTPRPALRPPANNVYVTFSLAAVVELPLPSSAGTTSVDFGGRDRGGGGGARQRRRCDPSVCSSSVRLSIPPSARPSVRLTPPPSRTPIPPTPCARRRRRRWSVGRSRRDVRAPWSVGRDVTRARCERRTHCCVVVGRPRRDARAL